MSTGDPLPGRQQPRRQGLAGLSWWRRRQDDPTPQWSATDRLELQRLEYTSLREESAQARGSQQAILQWSLAAFAALFGSGLLFVSKSDGSDALDGTQAVVFLSLFGVVIPAFALAAFMAWWGELLRMERAGCYLRGLEIHLAEQATAMGGPSSGPPLRWETFIQRRPGAGGKQRVGYLGSLVVYVGSALLSLGIFVVSVRHQSSLTAHSGRAHACYVYACVFAFMNFLVTGYLVNVLQKSGREYVKYDSIHPDCLDGPFNYVDELPALPKRRRDRRSRCSPE